MYVGSQKLLMNYDQYLLDHGYTIEELIDKASDCLFPHFAKYDHIAIFAGPGNNGADGLSLALKLVKAIKRVVIYYIGDPTRFSSGNRYYFDLCVEKDIEMHEVTERTLDLLESELQTFEVVVDAFFGFGLHSAPRGLYADCISSINHYFGGDVIAVDIPTGLNCNTGQPYQSVIYATKTIALTALKQGYLNPDSRIFTGEVTVEELDIEDVFFEAGLYELIDEKYAVSHLKPRLFDGYKNKYGVDLLIVGSKDYHGAPVLCAKAAIYSGAGIVKVLTHPDVADSLHLVLPEAIGIERPLIIRKEDLAHHNAVLLGCGIGLDLESYQLVESVLKYAEVPLIIDADALTILSEDLSILKKYRHPAILTPHLGEFKRLIEYHEDDDLMLKAIAFAKEYHVILVLKGPYTMITDGKHHYRVASGNGAMAVGGMGDTLAGIITALVGGLYDPLDAAILGVYLHGAAGDLLARDAYTVIPEKVSEVMPSLMQTIIAKQK